MLLNQITNYQNTLELNLMERFQSWSLGNVEYPFITITPRSTLTGVVVSVRVSSIDQIELFNYLLKIIIISYLKPFSYVEIVHIR